MTITEYHLYGFICPKCGKVVWAKLPSGVVEGQLFQPRLQALMGYMKGSLHASYSALEDFCREVLNIDVARSHLCNTISRDNDALARPYGELQRHIPTEPVLSITTAGLNRWSRQMKVNKQEKRCLLTAWCITQFAPGSPCHFVQILITR